MHIIVRPAPPTAPAGAHPFPSKARGEATVDSRTRHLSRTMSLSDDMMSYHIIQYNILIIVCYITIYYMYYAICYMSFVIWGPNEGGLNIGQHESLNM